MKFYEAKVQLVEGKMYQLNLKITKKNSIILKNRTHTRRKTRKSPNDFRLSLESFYMMK